MGKKKGEHTMDFNNLPEFGDVKQTCQWIPSLKVGGVRHLLFVNKEFREKCAKKIGRKILLHIPSVLEFIKEQPCE